LKGKKKGRTEAKLSPGILHRVILGEEVGQYWDLN
jgi:hypothetical protein